MQSRHDRRTTWTALALLIAWLVIAGGLTWQRSRESVIPPVWDQKSYVMKAEAFWLEVNAGKIANPFNVQPSSRPPGTILLTAPTGPLKDYRNFYFRSAFIPVAMMVLAVFLAGMGITKLAWPSTLVAISAGSMPMFWQFEIGEIHKTGYSWGLMDTYQAGLSAMAMAGLLVAAVGKSQWWTVPAVIALGLVPLVKPSGFLLAGLISLSWMVITMRFSGTVNRKRKNRKTEILATGLLILGVLGGLGLASLRSDYFSTANMEFGKTALAQLRADWMRSDIIKDFIMLFTRSIGLPLLTWLVLLGGISLHKRDITVTDHDWKQQAQWAALSGIAIMLIGLGLTYQATMFRQTRYFFPVLAISTVLLTPLLISWCVRAGAYVCSTVLLVPASLLLFLASPRMSIVAYELGGYGLFSGFNKQEASATKRWFDQFTRKETESPVLFTTTDGSASAAVEAVFMQRLRERGATDEAALNSIARPFDWEKGGVVRIADIYNADLIVVDNPPKNAAKQISMQTNSQSVKTSKKLDYSEEISTWKMWLSASPETGSTSVVLETPRMIALQIKDRSLLNQSMRKYITSRRWRPEFVIANQPGEFDLAEITPWREEGQLLSMPVTFDNVLRVHGLALSRNSRESPGLELSIYSESNIRDSGRNLRQGPRTFGLFVHQLDNQGETLTSQVIPLKASRLPGKPITNARGTIILLAKTAYVGLGIYEPSANLILPTNWLAAQGTVTNASRTDDADARYWRGRRARIAVESIPLNRDSSDKP